ncbi:DUF3471 domain-containing protein [Anthocerotibacter panamensis]|uniref:DUF3471 domain-containing protein n=1 Tax=Anthocerotibacter panamensis TaxID=2857077 RepID=UPI001C40304F|nr:DUF3471 domain-containing protein [Anthocerotibacter panamensis]
MVLSAEKTPYSVLVGTYRFAPFVPIGVTVSEENGHLYAQATGFPKGQLSPQTGLTFAFTAVNAQITFVRDEHGKVTQLHLTRDGQKLPPARKVS